MATIQISSMLEKAKRFLNDMNAKNALVFWNGKRMPEFSWPLPDDNKLTNNTLSELEKNHYYLVLPKKITLEEPIYIFYIVDEAFKGTHKRTIVIEEDCEISLIEVYLSAIDLETENHISHIDSVTTLKICSNTKLNHVVLHQANKEALHSGKTIVEQAHHSEYLGTAILIGGQFNLEFNISLCQPHAKSEFYALEHAKHGQQQEILLTVNHQQPDCQSHTLARCVVGEKAKSTFKGKIVVQPNAKNTDAFLENKNLLLCPSAEANTAPELEIYNKDVRCSHGATVGNLDPEALFYLRSRGISEKEAKRLLITSFIQPSLKNIKAPGLLHYIERLIDAN